MGMITTIISLIPAALELMKLAEGDYASVPKAGADKKSAVLSGMQAIVADINVWDKVSGFLSGAVDILAKLHLGARA